MEIQLVYRRKYLKWGGGSRHCLLVRSSTHGLEGSRARWEDRHACRVERNVTCFIYCYHACMRRHCLAVNGISFPA